MRLLVCTQAVDRNDSDLGFFVRWVEEFSKHCEQVTVICLRKGDYALPQNVRVFPLGGSGKLSRAYKLLRGAWKFRNNYDAVFVHMNPEYLVVAGWLWRILGKKTGLWYVHKSVDLKLRIAVFFANVIFTASKESFRLKSKKVHIVGHGIDTNFFTPDSTLVREDHWLSVGRLMKSKRHDRAIELATLEGKELHIAGEGVERKNLEALAQKIGARVTFLGGISQAQLRDEYRKAALLIHTSETGSLDKVVLEALAVGLPVRTSNLALKHLAHEGPDYIQKHHSLQNLVPRILKYYGSA